LPFSELIQQKGTQRRVKQCIASSASVSSDLSRYTNPLLLLLLLLLLNIRFSNKIKILQLLMRYYSNRS